MTEHQPLCCLCGAPCEPWHDPPTGYGHNPAPLGNTDHDRCCDACNATKVIPARLGLRLPPNHE
jgi:hypothetical protein